MSTHWPAWKPVSSHVSLINLAIEIGHIFNPLYTLFINIHSLESIMMSINTIFYIKIINRNGLDISFWKGVWKQDILLIIKVGCNNQLPKCLFNSSETSLISQSSCELFLQRHFGSSLFISPYTGLQNGTWLMWEKWDDHFQFLLSNFCSI